MKTCSVNQALKYGIDILKKVKIDSLGDALVLLTEATSLTKAQLLTNNERLLNSEELNKYYSYIEKRKTKMPVQYIINKCEFMSLDFYVDKNVLIPRPDTEILVEETIKIINNNDIKIVLEIGVGSGCIAVSLSKYCPNIKVYACDISPEALLIAKKNAQTNGVSPNITFLESNIFEKLHFLKNNVNIIVSNPPYISKEDIKSLEENVKNFEPKSALDGGYDGLDFYRHISQNAKYYLKQDGFIIYEIGYNQGFSVSKILKENNFCNIKIIKDLSCLDRVVSATERTG